MASDKQAIGFVSFAYTAGVNPVGYNGVACNLRNAKSGQYGGVRNFWMVTKGAPKGEALKFLAWVTSGNTTSRTASSTPAGSRSTRRVVRGGARQPSALAGRAPAPTGAPS